MVEVASKRHIVPPWKGSLVWTETAQISANGKRRFYSFVEFYAINLKIQFDHRTTLIFPVRQKDYEKYEVLKFVSRV